MKEEATEDINILGDDLTHFSVYPKAGGARITSYAVGIHADTMEATEKKAAEDYPDCTIIRQTKGEWEKAVNNNLYYDTESEGLVDPPEPTEEEIRAAALASLDSEYERKISDIESEMTKAAAIGDDELLAELKEERADLITEYETKREEI